MPLLHECTFLTVETGSLVSTNEHAQALKLVHVALCQNRMLLAWLIMNTVCLVWASGWWSFNAGGGRV
jgi:hypothetical protein